MASVPHPVTRNGRLRDWPLELAKQFEHEHPAVRPSLIEAQVFPTYQKQLNNLSIQEARLRKQREKDCVELETLQQQRKERLRRQLNEAWVLYEDAKTAGQAFDPAAFGFEFSIRELEQRIVGLKKDIAIRNRTYYRQNPHR